MGSHCAKNAISVLKRPILPKQLDSGAESGRRGDSPPKMGLVEF